MGRWGFLGPFARSNFSYFFTGQVIANTGIWFQNLALALVIRSNRIASTGPLRSFGNAVAVSANTARAAAIASIGSDLPYRCRP